MIQNAHIGPLDLYEIASAQRRDPDALQTALSRFKEDHLHDIDAELGYLRPGWIEQHHQPLIERTSRGDPANAVGIVRGVLQEDIRSRSPRPLAG